MRLRPLLALFFAAFLGVNLQAQATNTVASAVTDPSYVLSVGDTVSVTVIDEPELSVVRLIDKTGAVRLEVLDIDFPLAGKSVRAAEEAIANAYKSQELLRFPQVRISVVEYAARFVTVLGAVRTPGKIAFTRDTASLDIIDVITQAGGFLPTAKDTQVRVTRTDAEGKDTTVDVDVRQLMSGTRRSGSQSKAFVILPGDRIYVPPSIF